jgi:putative membrane-bound dehydrogenase-like protein
MPNHFASTRHVLRFGFMLLIFISATRGWTAEPEVPLADLDGKDFDGGARESYGSSFYNRDPVNFVYAQSTGGRSKIKANFRIAELPKQQVVLHLTAMNDDAGGNIPVSIQLNGTSLHSGNSNYANGKWEVKQFSIPGNALKQGDNELTIENLEPQGPSGGPPWFMIADAAIASPNFKVDPTKSRAKPYLAKPIDKIQTTGESRRTVVGTSKVEITPTEPVLLNGYAGRKHELTQDVVQPLFVRGIAIGKDDEGPAVLLTFDNLGVTTEIHRTVAAALEKSHQLPRARLTITASHTHSAPVLKDLAENIITRELTARERAATDDYTKFVTEQLIAAAQQALDKRKPASLSRGAGVLKFAMNRRGGKIVDHSLPLLVAADESGKPLAIVTNYACHCVSGGSGAQIHGDWSGYAAAGIEADMPGVTALVVIGCGADQNPGETGNSTVSQRLGRQLANEINRLLTTTLQPVNGKLKAKFTEITLPLQDVPNREYWLAREKKDGVEGLQARKNLARLERGEKLPAELNYPVQTWVFGEDLALVFLGGEVVVDYSALLKKKFDAGRLWITAYANDNPGYIPSERILKEGGYEGGGAMIWYDKPAMLATGVEKLILDEVGKQLGSTFISDYDSSKTGGTLALTPEKSIQRMKVRPGYRVEVVAAEPLVVDPVAIDFGPDGKLWVAEMHDYPMGLDGNHTAGGKIKYLEDTNGDGKYDKSVTFLEDVPFPTGVTAWRHGVLICAAPDVIYAEDTDGDGKADIRKVVLQGFQTHNYQARVNSLSLGLDNWIYGAAGIFGGNVSAPGHKAVDSNNRDFRFQPDTGIVEAVSGRTQQGRARDDWGNWFGCENGTLLFHYPVTEHYLRRNPSVFAPNATHSALGNQKLFPLGKLVQFAQSGPAGAPTSACGLAIYRDTWLGDEFANNAFVCEPVNQLVHRMELRPNGNQINGARPKGEESSEFLASTDNWFRPVQAKTGPDGGLYIVDMYRYVIEYPRFLSDEVKSGLDLRAGDTRGRIYRVVKENTELRKPLHPRGLTTVELAKQLESPNGTVRDMAQLELLWRADKSAAETLTKVATSAELPQARLQALTALDGLNTISVETVKARLADQHPGVRRHAVRLSEKFLALHPEIGASLISLVNDPEPQIRLQLAYSLGQWEHEEAAAALANLLLNNRANPYITSAVLSSLNRKNAAGILASLELAAVKQPDLNAMRNQVLNAAIAVADKDSIETVLKVVLKPAGEDYHVAQLKSYPELIKSLKKRGIALNGESWNLVRQSVSKFVTAEKVSADLRIASLALLPLLESDGSCLQSISQCLAPQFEPEVQTAAIAALAAIPGEPASKALFAAWQKLTPSLQPKVLDEILAREQLTLELLQQLEAGSINRGQLDSARRQALTNHPKAEIQQRAKTLFSAPSSTEIAAIAATFREVKPEHGDVGQGRQLFAKHCAGCHRLGDQGHVVGPDLASLTDKSTGYLLTSILDPNAAVDQRYATYSAVTKEGRVITGVLASESGNEIVIKEKESKEQKLLRADLDELLNTGKSMMPDGLGKELKPAEMEHLLAFVKSASAAKAPLDKYPSLQTMRALAASMKIGTPDEYRLIPKLFGAAIDAGKRNDLEELRGVLDFAMPRGEDPLRDWEAVVIGGGVVNGISQAGAWPATRIAEILGRDADLLQRWNRTLQLAVVMADNPKINAGTRYDAMRMVAMLPYDTAKETLARYLSGTGGRDLLQGSVSGLADVPNEEAALLLVATMEKLDKELGNFAVAGLIRVDGEKCHLLSAVTAGKITPDKIPPAVIEKLLAHPNAQIQAQAKKLLVK